MTPVEICDYDKGWPKTFESLAARIRPALGDLVERIEHVGSTAVPGLAARPIIDIVIVIKNRTHLQDAIARLAAIGYQHEGDLAIPGREAFRQPASLPVHHLYVCARHARELKRHLDFRDDLVWSKTLRSRYADLKRQLAVKFPNNRQAYVLGKSEFIERALGRENPA